MQMQAARPQHLMRLRMLLLIPLKKRGGGGGPANAGSSTSAPDAPADALRETQMFSLLCSML